MNDTDVKRALCAHIRREKGRLRSLSHQVTFLFLRLAPVFKPENPWRRCRLQAKDTEPMMVIAIPFRSSR